MRTLSYDAFIRQYRPIQNPLNAAASMDGAMFETYGEEKYFVDSHLEERKIWTLLDDSRTIIAGFHVVNRLGYFIAEIPYEHGQYGEITAYIS